MKIDLGYNNGSELASPSKPKNKVRYPRLRFDVTKEHEAIFKKMPKSGKATIQFNLKNMEIGEKEYGPADCCGSIELEVESLDVGADKDIKELEADAIGSLISKLES